MENLSILEYEEISLSNPFGNDTHRKQNSDIKNSNIDEYNKVKLQKLLDQEIERANSQKSEILNSDQLISKQEIDDIYGIFDEDFEDDAEILEMDDNQLDNDILDDNEEAKASASSDEGFRDDINTLESDDNKLNNNILGDNEEEFEAEANTSSGEDFDTKADANSDEDFEAKEDANSDEDFDTKTDANSDEELEAKADDDIEVEDEETLAQKVAIAKKEAELLAEEEDIIDVTKEFSSEPIKEHVNSLNSKEVDIELQLLDKKIDEDLKESDDELTSIEDNADYKAANKIASITKSL